MVLDSIANLRKYEGLCPRMAQAIHYLETTDLSALPVGHHQIDGEDVFVNIMDCSPKTRAEARIETHNRMLDIQVPISGPEEHGWIARQDLPQADYDEANDIAFYPGLAQTYFEVRPGQFTIYSPTDGHAPAVTSVPVRKAIVKVRV